MSSIKDTIKSAVGQGTDSQFEKGMQLQTEPPSLLMYLN